MVFMSPLPPTPGAEGWVLGFPPGGREAGEEASYSPQEVAAVLSAGRRAWPFFPWGSCLLSYFGQPHAARTVTLATREELGQPLSRLESPQQSGHLTVPPQASLSSKGTSLGAF